jgi:hypothetical protein
LPDNRRLHFYGSAVRQQHHLFGSEFLVGSLARRDHTAELSMPSSAAAQRKGLPEYQALMQRCFAEFCRILKPGRWITVEFHNSRNNVWMAIQEALLHAGFVVADVRTLDKQQKSFKQITAGGTVKQDLIISAYKPMGADRACNWKPASKQACGILCTRICANCRCLWHKRAAPKSLPSAKIICSSTAWSPSTCSAASPCL